MPDKQKSINSNNPDALLKVLVQLVFVNHIYNLTKFYCSISFARQYSFVFQSLNIAFILASSTDPEMP